jgi:hypothetical protein
VLSYDVAFTKQPSDAIRSEADRFISIGLQKIADGYSISATGWDIRRSPCGKNGLQVEILSPYSSTSLSSDSVSANIASLLRLDKSFDDTSPFRSTAYRWRFSSTAFIFPGTADPKSLNVTANIRVELEGHNAYASSSFQPINVASTQALQLFDDQLSQALFAAYVTTMKAQGVTISLPKDTQSDLPAIK